MYALSVDPGVEGGYAVWDTLRWELLVPPVECGVIAPQHGSWEQRVNEAWDQLNAVFDVFGGITDMYCEYPMFFGAESSVATGTGDLLKLMYHVGGIALLAQFKGAKFHPIPVNQWKGQVPKDAMWARIQKRYGAACPKARSHARDAIGIGLYVKGFL